AAVAEATPPAAAGQQQPAAAAARGVERRQVGLLLFTSTVDFGSIQTAVRGLGGEIGHAARGKYAAIFPGEAGQAPVRRARRAAQGLAEKRLAVRGIVDLGALSAQRRPDGSTRWLAPELARPERYPEETDPQG